MTAMLAQDDKGLSGHIAYLVASCTRIKRKSVPSYSAGGGGTQLL